VALEIMLVSFDFFDPDVQSTYLQNNFFKDVNICSFSEYSSESSSLFQAFSTSSSSTKLSAVIIQTCKANSESSIYLRWHPKLWKCLQILCNKWKKHPQTDVIVKTQKTLWIALIATFWKSTIIDLEFNDSFNVFNALKKLTYVFSVLFGSKANTDGKTLINWILCTV